MKENSGLNIQLQKLRTQQSIYLKERILISALEIKEAIESIIKNLIVFFFFKKYISEIEQEK